MSGASSTARPEILVAEGRADQAALGAELCGRAIQEAVDRRGVARVALSGGSTPTDTYQALAALSLPWSQVEWFWVDERAVGPDHPRSNFGAAAKDLGLHTGARGRFHRMPGEAEDLDGAARGYEALLRRSFGVASAVSFDAMTLGVGDDGHTASLFPGLGVVGVDDRLVISIPEQPDKKLEPRISLTAPVICEAKLVVVLARGAGKKPVIERALAPGSEDAFPSRLLQRARGRVVWLVDRDAAPSP
ncbi:MAG: 6-phosphogluconolactonase [Byssovorax sp.]